MSEVVGVETMARNSEGFRETYELGSEVRAPRHIEEKFETSGLLRGYIKEFEDEGNRITAKCVLEVDNQVETFYWHFPVGNLKRVIYAKMEGDE